MSLVGNRLVRTSGKKPAPARRTVVFLVLFSSVLVALWIGRVPLLSAAGHALVEDDGPASAQAAVVLGGDEFGNRILKAAELQKSGFVPLVLVSGPPSLDGFESDQTIPFAVRRGYPASIFRPVTNRADSTRSESKILTSYLRQNGFRSIVLVTSNYHTRRAGFLMRQADAQLTVRVVPAPDPNFDPDSWWRTRNGQKMFLNEWTKTIAAKLGD